MQSLYSVFTNARTNKDVPTSKERNRHVHLLRQVCGKVTGIAGEKENDSRGTRRSDRNTKSDSLPVGEWNAVPYKRAGVSRRRRSGHQTFPSFGRPEKIIFKNFYRLVENPIDSILPSGRIFLVFRKDSENFFEQGRSPPGIRLPLGHYEKIHRARPDSSLHFLG